MIVNTRLGLIFIYCWSPFYLYAKWVWYTISIDWKHAACEMDKNNVNMHGGTSVLHYTNWGKAKAINRLKKLYPHIKKHKSLKPDKSENAGTQGQSVWWQQQPNCGTVRADYKLTISLNDFGINYVSSLCPRVKYQHWLTKRKVLLC